ncbi:ATP-dependent Clp protease ATP-binding subunit ClpX [Xenorhabdus stockiae]|uniref:ATP-dependent Clp protease ATP-binding subunit ClpX n=1 Tax=Xenorhabdus stockiae TaxID=351614 RepID=A0A2D0KKH8_9GAMM|nr:Arc family DNA-binding protein [Xenorhabdus stockiae]PHM63944.1 ATP-dependent Clp protease ATP-binding subunit ClpX [Xenorhabdus stockiae]
MSHKKRIPPYPLRMPDEVREWYEEESNNNGRSLNAEIVEVLKEEMNGYKAEKKHNSIKTKDCRYQGNKMALEIEKVNTNIGCSICGRNSKDSKKSRLFIAGLYGYICSSCVSDCVSILAYHIECRVDEGNKDTAEDNESERQ